MIEHRVDVNLSLVWGLYNTFAATTSHNPKPLLDDSALNSRACRIDQRQVTVSPICTMQKGSEALPLALGAMVNDVSK